MKRKVTTKGQVTIPKEIRDRLGIHPGTEVEFKIEDRRVILRRVAAMDPIDALVGLIEEPIDVDAYLVESRGPGFDPRLDPPGPLTLDAEE
ncbi:MAG: AbrB/MazE/SpoVT family DNA-binding domain-containing protein [Gemmatimonadetes bacterium]|nr:AbrB/MazE/SpoVT family DNA-binding domain-containing protein [Gemmatimonadota bacterium]